MSYVLKVVTMGRTVFWNVKPWSVAQVYRRFGRMYRLTFQGRRVSRAKKQEVQGRTNSLLSFDTTTTA
jgi:hypothetical protein